jgi:hypothetical protein
MDFNDDENGVTWVFHLAANGKGEKFVPTAQ